MIKKMLLAIALCSIVLTSQALDVEHKFTDSNGVKIHYAAAGKGSLMVFIHGFPDYWYSWHRQMAVLQDNYRVAALDTRGYNKSGQPEQQSDYDMTLLTADVAAVIKAEQRDKAIIVGHDWGGVIAWNFVAAYPDLAEKLVIVNLPHPKNMARELSNNEEQRKNAQYARNFQHPESHTRITAAGLARAHGHTPELHAKYLKAFENSSFSGMMNYYRQNYPKPPYDKSASAEFPRIAIPVLQFHGLNDTALHHAGLNGTWEHLDKDYTLVTIPGVGHWAHHEASDLVTETISWWLKMR